MNRVLFVFSVSVLSGILLPDNLPILMSVLGFLVLIQVSVYAYSKRFTILPVILGVSFGFLLSVFGTPDSVLLPQCGKTVSCTIEVQSVPEKNTYGFSFEGMVRSVSGKPVSERTIVYVNGEREIKENTLLTFNTAKLNLPSEQMNFNSFDYQKYLKSKKIFVTVTAKAENITKATACKMNLSRLALKTNAYLCRIIDKSFGKDDAALLKGLLLGDKSGLSGDVIADFRSSGLSHVLAVSGLHLSMITMILGLFLRFFSKRTRAFFLLLCIWGFAFIVGLPVSVVRAAFMLSVLTLSDCLHCENDTLTNMALVALILMVQNPYVVYDTSFTMSFSATLGIVCVMPFFKDRKPKMLPSMLWESLMISFSAQIGIMPVSLLNFGHISFVGLIGNLLIAILIPVIYLMTFLSFIFRFQFLLSVNGFLLKMLSLWAEICAKIPFGTFVLPFEPILIFGVFALALVFLLLQAFPNVKIPSIAIGVCLLLIVSGSFIGTAPPKHTEITFINVGQADCAILRTTAGENYLIDVGTAKYAENEVVPFLQREGVTHLNGIFISHFDDDHCGGIEKVTESLKTDVLYVPDTTDVGVRQYEIIVHAGENGIQVIPLQKDDVLQAQSVRFTVLHPDGTVPDKHNISSLVVRADNGDFSAVFPGDLEKDNVLRNCDADILKVTHHGSANGSTQAFIDSCTPEIAVISLAKNNSYGFPVPVVLDRLRQHTNHIYRTDLNGTVRITCNNFTYYVHTLR